MFRRKDKQDVIHQTNIKRGITSHFARTLKVLQQRHLQSDSDEFIYSDDFSNNLCSSLEAVFLHGLKDSVVTKMSNYVGLANVQDQAQYINFWTVCSKFTHKDVVTQLRSLAQINTDIGLCRAWIRIALNDGLMESYLHSMIVDHKLLSYYYHSYSYLRDHEQPGILKNFLTGLMSISFKLSFNSSVLNLWSNSALQLAGLLDYHNVPTPVSSAATEPSVTVSDKRTDKKRLEDEPIVATKTTMFNPKSDIIGQSGAPEPMFSTIQDVEAIRQMTIAQMMAVSKSVTSEGSTSSHISCPDPGSVPSKEGWEKGSDVSHVISPALYPRADRDITADKKEREVDTYSVNSLSVSELSIGVQSEETQEEPKASVILEDSPFFELELAQSPARPRSRRVTDDDLKSVAPKCQSIIRKDSSTSHSLSNSPKPSDFALKTQEVEISPTKTDTETVVRIPNPTKQTLQPAPGQMPRKLTAARGYEEICATLPPLKLDPVEQEAILKKVLGEIDKQADIEREIKEEQRMSMGYDDNFEDVKIDEKIDDGKKTKSKADGGKEVKRDSGVSLSASSAQLDKESNSSVKNGIIVDNEQSPKALEKDSVPDIDIYGVGDPSAAETDIHQMAVSDVLKDESTQRKEQEVGETREEREREELSETLVETGETGSPSSGNFGNSLSGMVGWSSELETSPVDTENRSLRAKTRGESFATMLKAYAGQNSLISTTLDQVIQTFYGTDDNSPPSPTGLSPLEEDAMLERQDSCLEDFEILTAPSNSFQSIQEMDSCRSIFLFRVAQEHGLSHQNFTCRGCSRPIGIIYGQPRLCEFDGGLYCYECHENNESCIPAAIVYNWDFGKKKVCIENFKFLQELEDQALYDLEELNPKLRTHVSELETLTVLREQLCFLKSYLFNCTQKVAESLRQKVWPREHLYDRPSVYSVNDFHQVLSGVLGRFIKDLVKFASKHVYECSLCSLKGFVCEICRNPQVIFPFELDSTVRCSTCKSVYHKTCMTENLPCPKCARWGKRNQTSPKKVAVDHPEDYGVSPTF